MGTPPHALQCVRCTAQASLAGASQLKKFFQWVKAVMVAEFAAKSGVSPLGPSASPWAVRCTALRLDSCGFGSSLAPRPASPLPFCLFPRALASPPSPALPVHRGTTTTQVHVE